VATSEPTDRLKCADLIKLVKSEGTERGEKSPTA
jgi:hypothetical protein